MTRYSTQYHCRGRWRLVKRRMQRLAEELNYPDCLRVTHYDSIVGAVMQACARQRSFAKLSKVRGQPGTHRAARVLKDQQRRRSYHDPHAIPF